MDKYIVFAGRKVPIETSYPVLRYDDDTAPSYYHPEKTLSADKLMQMALLRPTLMNYCPRYSKEMRFERTAEQLFGITRAELDALGKHIWQIALHHDVTMCAADTYNVLCTRGLSTHFCVNYDGTLYQYMDPYHMAWATGENNNHSVAIDMNNPVYTELRNEDPANGMRDIYQGKINGSVKTMLGYTEAQYETITALIKAFITEINIPGEEPWTPLPLVASNCFPPISENGEVINRLLRDSKEFKGFLGHYHCSANKWDPGPAFDWLRVLSGIKGKQNSFPILLGDPSEQKNLAECGGKLLYERLKLYYDNAEQAAGGWYPLGSNQSWHSGVHLTAPTGSPILNMMAGTIVAIRNVKTVDLGDPSFVLVRHSRKEDGDDGNPRDVYWFSLYMHLEPMYTDEDLKKCPWVSELLLGETEVPDSVKYLSEKNVDTTYIKGIPQTIDGTMPKKNHQDIVDAFYRGDIILTNIECESGVRIGTIGQFGEKPDRLAHQLHVEVFSTENIFKRAGSEKEAWQIIEGDYGDSSRVDVKKILRPIQEYVRYQTGKSPKLLKSSEIGGFFAMSPNEPLAFRRDDFRKMICYHKSEWSPTMNWTKTAIETVGWQWESEASFGKWLLLWLPFQWMTRDVATALELGKGQFFTYHPIYLLEQLNKTYAGDVSQNAEVASDAELSENANKTVALVADLVELNGKLKDKSKYSEEDWKKLNEERDKLYAQMDDHMDDERADISAETTYEYYNDEKFERWEPGEWLPPSQFDLKNI